MHEVTAVGFSAERIGHDELVLEGLLALRRRHARAAAPEERIVGDDRLDRRGRPRRSISSAALEPVVAVLERLLGRARGARTRAAGRSACAPDRPTARGGRRTRAGRRCGRRRAACPWPSDRADSRRPGVSITSVGREVARSSLRLRSNLRMQRAMVAVVAGEACAPSPSGPGSSRCGRCVRVAARGRSIGGKRITSGWSGAAHARHVAARSAR